MAKQRTIFICQQCDSQFPRWQGRCTECGAWDSLVEQVVAKSGAQSARAGASLGAARAAGALNQPLALPAIATGDVERMPVRGSEFGRVLGGGIVPGSLVLIGGEPGAGKCLAGETRVFDPITGALRPITDWQAEKTPVLTLDRQHKLAPQAVTAFHSQGRKPVVLVRTRLGRRLRCTENHPVLTADGWRPVGSIQPGTQIAAPRSLPYFGSEAMSEHKIKAIAYALSDGSAQSSIDVTTAIPECIFRLPREQMALFLKILFTCDGSVYVKNDGGAGISYTTISLQLAQEVQHLLLRFGLVAKLRTKTMRVNNEPYIAYEIQLFGYAGVKRFLSEIGILGREEAKSLIDAMSAPTLPPSRSDTIPTGTPFWTELQVVSQGSSYKEISRRTGVAMHYGRDSRPLTRSTIMALADSYGSKLFTKLAYGDIYWDEIESITPDGEDDVYDISVPNGANFVAADLIVHNSTLLLQVSAEFANDVGSVLYISAEESQQQIKMRAGRLGLDSDRLFVLAETNLDTAIAQIEQMRPRLVIVDSIQTVYSDEITSAAGSVSQVREGALRLQRVAKGSGTSIFLVGHVTKEGAIAGPRVLEHIVDVVLYIEGDRFHQYRLLRGVKNRFGSTNEVGVFEMTQGGMTEVPNPSQVFLAERSAGSPGSVVAVTLEGTRPLLIEVQALTSHTANAQPRRTANGFDPNRLAMIIAVLSKRVGIPLFNQDIYVNIVGGLKIAEPAVDVAVATAITSSFRNQRVDPEAVMVGEIGLSGELRSVSQLERRLNEASKLGFHRAIVPQIEPLPQLGGFEVHGMRSLTDAVRGALIGRETGAAQEAHGGPAVDHDEYEDEEP